MATAILYTAGLSRARGANNFYSAAVEAGATSWKAFFFGSFDQSGFITVDKLPALLWVMDISARLFGLNRGACCAAGSRGRRRRRRPDARWAGAPGAPPG